MLDNARHADQVRPLLPSGPGSLALITSRDRLPGLTARDGARRLTLDILSPAEAVDLLVAVIGPERVAAEPEAAGRLVELCGRLPLAIRITAAQLAERPGLRLTRHAADLAAGDRLAALALPEDDDASVRVAFGHSYTGLKPEAARLFRLLALVPGPDFGAGAAAAVGGIGRPEATRLLNALVTAHLIEPQGGDRYGFHDLMRLYAADQLVGDPERGSAVRRFYHWYVVSADAAAWRLSPERLHLPIPAHFSPSEPVEFADRERALAWCDAERDSFHAAVTAPPEGTDPEAVWLLAEGVRYYFLFRLYMGPALEMAYAALDAARDCPDPRVLAATHYSVATQLMEREDFVGARTHFDRALVLAREGGLTTEQAVYLLRAGTSLRYDGRLAESAHRFAEALPLFALKDEDRDGYAVTQCLLGDLYRYLGRYPEAEALMTEGIATLEELRPNMAALNVTNLGSILLDLGRDAEALAHFEGVVEAARAMEHVSAELQVLPRLSCAHRRLGRPEEARRFAEAALELCERLPAAAIESEARSVLAVLHAECGEPERALAHAYEAVRLCGKLPVSEARARAVLARVLLATGDRAAAAEQAARAARDSRAYGYRIALARSLAVLGEATGDPAPAAESAALHAELGVPHNDV
ncbi:tetratricopeptide repeat protein [Longispora urticae]